MKTILTMACDRSFNEIKPIRRAPRCKCNTNYVSIEFTPESTAYLIDSTVCPVCGYYKFAFLKGGLKENIPHNLTDQVKAKYYREQEKKNANG